MPPVVGDSRVAHGTLAGGTDRRDPPRRAHPLAQLRLGVGGRQAPEILGRLDRDSVLVDHQNRWLPGGGWPLLLVLATIQFTHVLDFIVMMPLGPLYTRDLGLEPWQFGMGWTRGASE